MVWYYAESGQQRGPISDSELDAMIANGRVAADTLVWQDGMENWEPLGKVRDVAPAAPAARPAAGTFGAGVEPALNPGYSATIQPASASTLETCHNCGRQFPPQSFTRIANIRVCPNCAPAVLGQMQGAGAAAPGMITPVAGVPVYAGVRYGGFWIRAVAKSVDHLFYSIMLAPLYSHFMPESLRSAIMEPDADLVGLFMRVLKEGESFSLAMFPYTISIIVAYNALFVALTTTTPGKYLCGLKIISADGSRVSVAQAFSRAIIPGLLYLVGAFGLGLFSSTVLLVAYVMVAFDSEKRSLFDYICKTRVVNRK